MILSVLIGDHARHILVRECKHLGQQIVVVEVFQVVDLVEHAQVVLRDILNLLHHFLVLKILLPKDTVVVEVRTVLGWLIIDLPEVGSIF